MSVRLFKGVAILALLMQSWLGLFAGCSALEEDLAETQGARMSAKDALTVADGSVKAEYPDAYLTYNWMGSVETSGRPGFREIKMSKKVYAQVEGGMARRWEFEYCSPENGLTMRTVVEGGVATIEEAVNPSVSRFPLEKWQLDSDEAFETALGALSDEQRGNTPVPLEMKLYEPMGQILEATPNPCWNVAFYPGKLSSKTPVVIVTVDAMTGEIVRVFETTEKYQFL